MFSGLVYCADCGSKLYYSSYNKRKANAASFRCSLFTKDTELCTMHYIRESAIYNLVLEDMKRVFFFVTAFEKEFAQMQLDSFSIERQKELFSRKRELEKSKQRIKEIDTLIQKLYEDNALGKLSDERYATMSISLETEQKELTPELVHEFIEKIVVSAPTKINGKRYQQVDIYYNGVGVIKQPTAEEWEQQFQNKYLNTKEKTA